MKSLKPVDAADGDEDDKMDEWKVKGAADDLMRAEEHRQNPKLMKHVVKHLKKKRDAISSLAELRMVAKKKMEEPQE